MIRLVPMVPKFQTPAPQTPYRSAHSHGQLSNSKGPGVSRREQKIIIIAPIIIMVELEIVPTDCARLLLLRIFSCSIPRLSVNHVDVNHSFVKSKYIFKSMPSDGCELSGNDQQANNRVVMNSAVFKRRHWPAHDPAITLTRGAISEDSLAAGSSTDHCLNGQELPQQSYCR